jgi:DNA primase
VQRYDLDRADGRVDAMREAAKLVTAIRDRSKVDAFSRELAGMIGIEPTDVQREVRRASQRAAGPGPTQGQGATRRAAELPDPRDPRLFLERETLKLVVQYPSVVARLAKDLDGNDFTHGAYRALWTGIQAAGGPTAANAQWAAELRDAQSDERLQSLISALTVEPLPSAKEPDDAYVAQIIDRLRALTVARRIDDLKSRLQRTNPVEETADFNRMFGELTALEALGRDLRQRSLDRQ